MVQAAAPPGDSELGDILLVKDTWRTFPIETLARGPDGLCGCPRPLCLRESVKCVNERVSVAWAVFTLYFNQILCGQ